MKQNVTILGSTGSIGVNTLKVIAEHPERYQVYALTANTSVESLYQQCLQVNPRFAVMLDEQSANDLEQRLKSTDLQTKVLQGIECLAQVASDTDVDCVMAAIVGGAGLIPGLAAAKAGKKVLLANKEALVMAGELFIQAVNDNNATLLPIDSEHNAIFQCLPVCENGRFEESPGTGFEKIVLTASGGPFLHWSLDDMKDASPEQACAHPNWEMGRKISVDSATLVNKGLELIEASYLFSVEAEKIEVLIHPQSIVHSMVYYRDGSVLAQMGNPDMRTPIAFGLAWPERITSGVKPLDLAKVGKLDFQCPNENKFPGLRLGREAAEARGSAPLIYNAANEVAVAAFLAGKVSFGQIPVIIEGVLQELSAPSPSTINAVQEMDAQARALALRTL